MAVAGPICEEARRNHSHEQSRNEQFGENPNNKPGEGLRLARQRKNFGGSPEKLPPNFGQRGLDVQLGLQQAVLISLLKMQSVFTQ